MLSEKVDVALGDEGVLPLPHLPARSLNVDMEWLYGASESSNMEVDIGYIPQVSTQRALTQVRRAGGHRQSG